MNDWQPIELAPKDGTAILVWESPDQYAVVFWLTYIANSVAEDGWYFTDGHNDPIWYRAWPYITHWMRCPDPPVIPSPVAILNLDMVKELQTALAVVDALDSDSSA